MYSKEVGEMAFKQTKDLLDHSKLFHRRLGKFYEELFNRAPEEGTRELLNNLIGHERVMEARMAEYEGEVSDNILDTFFKYMIDERRNCIADYPVPDRVDTAYVIEATRTFDNCLSDFYREMARKAMSEHVREILLNMMDMELREQMALSKQVLELVAA